MAFYLEESVKIILAKWRLTAKQKVEGNVHGIQPATRLQRVIGVQDPSNAKNKGKHQKGAKNQGNFSPRAPFVTALNQVLCGATGKINQ